MAVAVRLILLAPVIFMISCTTPPIEGRLADGKLRPCPDKPNCISSEAGHPERNSVDPLPCPHDPVLAMQQLVRIIEGMGGEIRMKDESYLWAIFRSKFFRFVDDLEIRIDQTNKLAHIRSGARTGYYDFGVNRKRVEKLQAQFEEVCQASGN
jgi:uncharacterized protein (DUF1499 family)